MSRKISIHLKVPQAPISHLFRLVATLHEMLGLGTIVEGETLHIKTFSREH